MRKPINKVLSLIVSAFVLITAQAANAGTADSPDYYGHYTNLGDSDANAQPPKDKPASPYSRYAYENFKPPVDNTTAQFSTSQNGGGISHHYADFSAPNPNITVQSSQ